MAGGRVSSGQGWLNATHNRDLSRCDRPRPSRGRPRPQRLPLRQGILPPILDSIIISVVILAGPPITLLSLRKHRSVSLVVIAVFMAGAFVYGFNGHFYSEGADRVALDIADWTTVLFVGTAAALGVLEAIGLGMALAALSSGRRPSPASSEPA